ncbi:MAG: 23S rRNA (pseudouridine(1915)-N(3))-methyltransferase RlmH [Campylobacterales bacterium]|nr:23S rRNA (pseudouridine(1915)-N(3))-methyltransferase RlmH [Campylobacterales bacterium]
MKINVYSIEKKEDRFVESIINEFKKSSLNYAKIENIVIFNNKISNFQKNSLEVEAKLSYLEAFKPYLKGFNVALDVNGKMMDSIKFSKFFETNSEINFFIGGAFGFSKEFLDLCDVSISLSEMTMAHKIAKVVLFEQIFRALTIVNNHPYHK